ncbi:hypothetical protein GALL_373790 [mine drainage metagenome]|uniref:N-acetyltransferase domain-containing protein n=1 Tax=mine drainage metagenome TaxID=410659 RepID=A0A1J5QB22_9ZZZZ
MVSNVNWPSPLRIQPMTKAFARDISTWTYPDAWSVYNSPPESDLFTTEFGYLAVVGLDGTLVGFACSGAEARVPGLSEEIDTLDIGFGMNPIFVGKNHGAEFGAAIVDHYLKSNRASHLRVVVQSWNQRSLKLTKNLGFTEVGIHECEQNGSLVSYSVLTKALH